MLIKFFSVLRIFPLLLLLAAALLVQACAIGEDDPKTGEPVQFDLDLTHSYFNRLPTMFETMVDVSADKAFDFTMSLFANTFVDKGALAMNYELAGQAYLHDAEYSARYFQELVPGCEQFTEAQAFADFINKESQLQAWLKKGHAAPRGVLVGKLSLLATQAGEKTPTTFDFPYFLRTGTQSGESTIIYSSYHQASGGAEVPVTTFPFKTAFDLLAKGDVGVDSYRANFSVSKAFVSPADPALFGGKQEDLIKGLTIDPSADVLLSWTPPDPSSDAPASVIQYEILLNSVVDEKATFHSYTKCVVDDTGTATLPKDMADKIRSLGTGSGSLNFTRISNQHFDLPGGGDGQIRAMANYAIPSAYTAPETKK